MRIIALLFLVALGAFQYAHVRYDVDELSSMGDQDLHAYAENLRSEKISLVRGEQLSTLERPLDLVIHEERQAMLELWNRRLRLRKLMALYVGLGILLFLFPFLREWLHRRNHTTKMKRRARTQTSHRKIREGHPREVYVDPFEYERKRSEGFLTKEDATDWFLKDPANICDYCGGENVPVDPNGATDEVYLVTFYKRVPEGAVDQRVVLGSFWMLSLCHELQCRSCRKRISR